ncbi:TRAP transporter small permease [Oceanobacillus kapialis]|uniref:TRAP transporter small permease n=1 Tax=Oceanobacillus kapialis TaxID=481353 RepID=UPI00384B7740
MQGYVHFIDKLNQVVKYIVSAMFIVLAVLVVLQVVTRFIIDYPLSWSEEISRYLMIYIVFLGSALAMRNKEHIAIDFLMEVVSAKKKKVLNTVILWISLIFAAILLYFGAALTLTVVGQATPTLQFSMSWAYAAIPLGALLLLLNTIAVLMEDSKSKTIERGGAQ